MFVNFPGFLTSLGAGEVVIGAITSVAAGAAIVARPWAGQTMDRFGRVPLIRISSIVRIGATLSLLAVGSVGPLVYVARSVYAVASAVFFTGLFTYASDVMPPERRAQGIAYYGLSGMSAATFGAALGAAVIGRFGFPALFLGMAAAELACVVVAFSLRALPDRPPLAHPGAIRTLAGERQLIPIWVLTIGFGAGYGVLFAFMRTFVDASGVGSVGLYFSTYSITAIVARLTLSTLPDRLGPTRMVKPAVLAFVAGFALLAIARSTPVLAAAAIAGGFGHAFMFPILGRLTTERAPDSRRGAALSLYTAMFDAGPLLAAPVLGLVIERAGYPAMFSATAFLVTVATAVFVVLDRRSEAVRA